MNIPKKVINNSMSDFITDLLYENIKGDVLLSIIITTYNRSEYLKEAIESVLSLNNPNAINYELLIISNNPNDSLREIINNYREYPISVYRNRENYGMISNVNLGVLHAKGKYVAFLHDDDLLLNNYLNCITPLLNRELDCLVTSRYIMPEKYSFDKKYFLLNLSTLFRYLYRGKVTRLKVENCAISGKNIYFAPTCGTLFKKKSLLEYGLFQDINGLAWDGANFLAFNKKYSIALVHEYTGIYRTYTGISNSKKTLMDFYKQSQSLYSEEAPNHSFLRFFKDEYNYNNIKIIAPETRHNDLMCRMYSLITAIYYYAHNLDGTRNLPKKYYDRGLR